MTPPRSLIGSLAQAPLFRHVGKRRLLFTALVAICAVLTLFPQKYRAALSLTPSDPTALGLGETVRQLGAINSVFGNQTATEVALKVARSQYVRDVVDKRIGLSRRLGKTPKETNRWLERKVDIRALRGGIVQFEMELSDADFAREIVATYGDAVREQLGIIAKKQTAYKRNILIELVGEASGQLAKARAAYDTFRLRTQTSLPSIALRVNALNINDLEGQIRAKEMQIATLLEFNTERNIKVQQGRAELAALRDKLAEARSVSSQDRDSLGQSVQLSTELERLQRDLDLAQMLYDNYKRFLQGTTVEDLTSTANVRVLEPAYVDADRQYNVIPLAIGILLALLAFAIEAYALRPPLADKVAA